MSSSEGNSMTCRELIAFLIEYLAGELSEAERAAFEEHMAECDECVAYLKSYQDTVALGKAAFKLDDPVPAEVPEKLLQGILAARTRAD